MKKIKTLIIIVLFTCTLIGINGCSSSSEKDSFFTEINNNKGSVILKIGPYGGWSNYRTLYLKDSTGTYKTIVIATEVAGLFEVGNTL